MAPPEARASEQSNHLNKVHILVLETDETHPDTQKEKGGFGEILNELLVEAGNEHDPELGIETRMQYIVEPDGGKIPKTAEITDDIHAILITGSEWDAHGDDEWIHKLMALIKGICFGHQILCRTLGSHIAPQANGEWELAHSPIILSHIGRNLFDLPQSEDRIHLHQMHLDRVVNPPSTTTSDLLPPGTRVHVWGTSEHTGVQGIYIQKRLFTTQGHMEFNEKMVRRQLEMRVQAGSVTKEDADEAALKAD